MIQEDAERATFLGTNVPCYRILAFVISGAVAACAGALYAPWTRIVTLEEIHWLQSLQNDLPARFGCIEDARAYCQTLFPWYNIEHRHSGIGYMTPHSVHYGHAQALRRAHKPPRCRPHSWYPPTALRPLSSTTHAAHRSLDQPADKGGRRHSKSTPLHNKFIKPGVAKSLTCSGRQHAMCALRQPHTDVL